MYQMICTIPECKRLINKGRRSTSSPRYEHKTEIDDASWTEKFVLGIFGKSLFY